MVAHPDDPELVLALWKRNAPDPPGEQLLDLAPWDMGRQTEAIRSRPVAQAGTVLTPAVARYFAGLSTAYHVGSETNLDLLERMQQVASLWVRGDVLDVGSGGLVHFALDAVKSLTLVDVATTALADPKLLDKGALVSLLTSPQALSLAKLTLKEADALFLPFEDASFDTVTLFYICHHLSLLNVELSRERTIIALREAARVLRRQGVLLVCEATTTALSAPAQDLLFGALSRVAARWGKPLPYFFSRRRLIRLLHAAGLAVVAITPLTWGRRVYNPLFPSWTVPGWLWGLGLRVNLFVVKRS